ncbi:MAG: phosphate ABC transporter permease subunit PstC [Proteobacteria bacterium]|nr:phosphate ABC transporter permease subunit PstC [Pseudomonadota bacterium]
MVLVYFGLMLLLSALAYYLGRGQASSLPRPLAALPTYHGARLALFAFFPMLGLFILWEAIVPRLLMSRAISSLPTDLQPADALSLSARTRELLAVVNGTPSADISETVRAAGQALASNLSMAGMILLVLGLAVAGAGVFWAKSQITQQLRARHTVEGTVNWLLIACSAIAILTTLGIVMSVVFETFQFFTKVSPVDFLFGTKWSPQTAIREDQVGSSGAFGFIPLFIGTLVVMIVAMCVAAPIGLFSAIYMAEYATPRVRAFAKPVLEILAGIPTVVYGFFAALTVAPLVRDIGRAAGFDVSSESALAAGIVMGVMITPFISSLADDVINAVPQAMRDGSYAMGATKSETVKKVVLPAALPGIVAAIMLAISKAIGETMIVVMAAGLAANLTLNPLNSVTTITVQIATMLVGDQEFDSAKTLSAFALGFVLFIFTLGLNIIALHIAKKYKEQYD